MRARPGPAYQPEKFTRGYSRELIVEHLSECLEIFAELAERDGGIPEPIAAPVFGVIQVMVASVEPAGAGITNGATLDERILRKA